MKNKKDICVICDKTFKTGDTYFPVRNKLICKECYKLINPLGIH